MFLFPFRLSSDRSTTARGGGGGADDGGNGYPVSNRGFPIKYTLNTNHWLLIKITAAGFNLRTKCGTYEFMQSNQIEIVDLYFVIEHWSLLKHCIKFWNIIRCSKMYTQTDSSKLYKYKKY